jgi:hypothetical protein
VAGRRARAGLALTAVGLTVAGCGLSKTKNVVVNHTHTVTVTVTRTVTATTAASTDPCSGGQLSGRFAVVAGSSGAGQIAYALKLTNTSQTSCSVLLAQVQLLDSNGSPLPTHLSGSTGASVLLSAGASAVANARFSPDVSGQGDSQGGPCQPTAHTLLVSLASGSVDAPIQPPTTVCEQGRLTFQPLAAG